MARDRQQVVGGPEGVLGRRNRWAGAAQHRRAEQSPRDVSRWLGQGGGPTLSAGVSQGRQWFPGHAEKNSKGKQSSGPEGKGVGQVFTSWFRGAGTVFSVDVAPWRGYSQCWTRQTAC